MRWGEQKATEATPKLENYSSSYTPKSLFPLHHSFLCLSLGSTNIYATVTNSAELLEQNCEPACALPPWGSTEDDSPPVLNGMGKEELIPYSESRACELTLLKGLRAETSAFNEKWILHNDNIFFAVYKNIFEMEKLTQNIFLNTQLLEHENKLLLLLNSYSNK